MITISVITGAVFLIVGILAILTLVLFFSRSSAVELRLRDMQKKKNDDARDTAGTGKIFEKAAIMAGEKIPMPEKARGKVRLMLVRAGYRKSSSLMVFAGVKVIVAAGAFLLAYPFAFSHTHKFLASLVLAALAAILLYLAPNVWLNEKIKRRQTEIFHSLPDILDLLTVCVEAGLGLDAAIVRIIDEFQGNVLAQEFKTASIEIRAGKPRMDALRDMGERTGVEDIRALVALLVQAEKLGASLARSLRVHSDSLRTKRRQIAEEAAAKTTIKMVFPLAFCIFPALMVVILGPAIIQIYDMMFKVIKK
jgi:tight adherence protein C